MTLWLWAVRDHFRAADKPRISFFGVHWRFVVSESGGFKTSQNSRHAENEKTAVGVSKDSDVRRRFMASFLHRGL